MINISTEELKFPNRLVNYPPEVQVDTLQNLWVSAVFITLKISFCLIKK